ncbi:hypothetical protein BDW22DRAFT_1363265 [Trametopsis cervina]|nr:hypothetical protein BDW22DRAFT_1363265 [Trametopsis cervina]
MDSPKHAQESQPPSKPKRTRKGPNYGRLAPLLNAIPVEIFLMIMTHLHPSDLLHLSRVSKAFRAILMSRSSKRMWAAARANVDGLPEPPNIVSEPKYAALLFDRTCFECGASRAGKVSFALGIRYCATCWKVELFNGVFMLKAVKGFASEDIVFKVLRYVPEKGADVRNRKYHGGEIREVTRELVKTWDEGIQDYCDERIRFVEMMQKHDAEVTEWLHTCAMQKKQEEQRISEQRRTSIEQKLFSLDFTPAQLPTIADDEWKNLVYQPRALTPRIWARIEPQLTALIAAEPAKRNARIEDRCTELLAILQDIDRLLPPSPILPFPSSALLFQNKALIDALQADGGRVRMTSTRFLAVTLDARHAHAVTVIHAFLKALRGSGAAGAAGASRAQAALGMVELHLATSIFPCYYCPLTTPVSADTYGWRDLLTHVRRVHLLDPHAFPHARAFQTASGKTSRAVLSALGMPANTLYTDVSEKVVCLCGKPGFVQPTTFANLLRHIEEENALGVYGHGASMISERETQATYGHDHDLSHAATFVKLLGHGETFAGPQVPAPLEYEDVFGADATFAPQ